MSSAQSLAAKKQEILKGWFQATVDSYPPDTAQFLKNQKDPFANPVGQTTHQSLDALVDALITGAGRDVMTAALDPILRIRAVQSFTPSMATSFVFSLKQIIRHHLPGGGRGAGGDMNDIDRQIDEMAMAAFDIYVACREKIFELKATESRKQFFGSLKRAGLIVEAEADGPGF
ncbi:RsbRD N-terminal domain-containing protein [uncultured Desulfosarcina sp.]|uniref:RsbRD N-terminal domain-containing protein n=1 Tax=uncultured Desulfosarcina sp. TaxID=218289 RepID=UPI0029C685D4|nr:RsbRD N-terminal domain-containing protein [uncultured Desulfosarcina sp.]